MMSSNNDNDDDNDDDESLRSAFLRLREKLCIRTVQSCIFIYFTYNFLAQSLTNYFNNILPMLMRWPTIIAKVHDNIHV